MSEFHRRRGRPSKGNRSFPTFYEGAFPARLRLSEFVSNLLLISNMTPEFMDLLSYTMEDPSLGDAIKQIRMPRLEKLQRQIDQGELTSLELQLNLCGFCHDCSEAQEFTLRTQLRAYLEESIGDAAVSEAYTERVEKLKGYLGLDDTDVGIIECCILYRTVVEFEMFCDDYASSEWGAIFAAALKQPVEKINAKILNAKGLQDRGMITIQRKNIEVSAQLQLYFTGTGTQILNREELSDLQPSPFPLDSFPVQAKQMELVKGLLRQPMPCHLLFYGRPGTGKTELARALVSQLGRKGSLVRYGNQGTDRDRRVALSAACGMMPKDTVLVIDEADCMLNSGPGFGSRGVDKGWINNFMDECEHTIIWITNEWRGIDPSIKRRFAYGIGFTKFTEAQRLSAWKWHAERSSLASVLTEAQIQEYARRYEVDAGCIASVCQVSQRLLQPETEMSFSPDEAVQSLLEHHSKLAGRNAAGQALNPIATCYDPTVLHTDLPAESILKSLKQLSKKELGAGELGVNLLFWGLPGTGKTEFAKHIARELGKSLLVKRMSDLQSMYVGETEKQIAAAFAEAAERKAILFLDEADSLILDRKTAVRNWETSQTNEVLTQMENFNGICICCTNLLENLDEAVLRRFTWKIKFLPLTDAGKVRLFRRYFHPKGKLAAAVVCKLKAIQNLTPGDFKTVWMRSRFSEPRLTTAELLDALALEASFKRAVKTKPIGFA